MIVNWNTCELLRSCLRSLEADLESGLCEVIVVDNGSVDGSVEMVEDEFPSVRLIANADNRGFTAATNQGHEIARGEYVLMLNSDTELVDPAALRSSHRVHGGEPRRRRAGLPDRLSRRVVPEQLLPLPEPARGASAGFVPAAALQAFTALNWDRYGLEVFTEPRDVDCVMGGFMMLRKRAVSEKPLLDEGYFMYAEEADLCYRLKSKGWRVVFYPGATVSHHHQASSGRNPRTAAWAYQAKQRGHLRFIRKWRGPVAAYFANVVMLVGLLPRALGWLAADTLAAASRLAEVRAAQRLEGEVPAVPLRGAVPAESALQQLGACGARPQPKQLERGFAAARRCGRMRAVANSGVPCRVLEDPLLRVQLVRRRSSSTDTLRSRAATSLGVERSAQAECALGHVSLHQRPRCAIELAGNERGL